MKSNLAVVVTLLAMLRLVEVASADTTPPAVASVSPPSGSITSLTEITVTFSEPVTGVDAADLVINGVNALIVTPASASTYVFVLQQPAYGLVNVGWRTGHNIEDQSAPPNPFNGTAPGSSWVYSLVDQSAPTLADLAPGSGATVKSLTSIAVLFNEPVSGVDASDLLINGTPAAALTW